MNLQRIRFLFIEICKTINSLNPDFMRNISEMKKNNRVVWKIYKFNLNRLKELLQFRTQNVKQQLIGFAITK